ncbi:MAG: YigZ family protein [Cyclobacteriaceae bacterium]|nr:YigZ family protein [Cyclobacteriaceae bacterium]
MEDAYKTISKTSEGEYKEKGSRFLAFAFPVSSENEIKIRLEGLRKQYYDARHHCYAYVLGQDYGKYRANDDGEPNHSAGDPILGQIKSKALTNTLVVVVRYFGGTKLGVSGLISAYKIAAEEALGNNKIVSIEITNAYSLNFGYESTNEIMRMVKEFNLEISEQRYEVDCFIKVNVNLKIEGQFKSKIKLLQDLGNKILIS